MASTLPVSSPELLLLPDALTFARWLHEAFQRHSEAPSVPWDAVPERSQALLVAMSAELLTRISAELWKPLGSDGR